MSSSNGVMMQYFHWYIDPDLILWNQLKDNAKDLAAAGFTAMWLPPAYKPLRGIDDVGYSVYDYYDLGEFNQQGSIRTRYGTKEQYLAAIEALHSFGVHIYVDTVLNHKIGGDSKETVNATPYDQDDRLAPKGPMREIEGYTHFHFPGRGKVHSDFEWHWHHFDAIDYDARTGERNTIYLLEGKKFDDDVALEHGNFAYLMGCDIDFESAEVQEELTRWGKWYVDTTKLDGFRLDAVKHISAWFFPKWLDAMEDHAGKDLFVVGEYWEPSIGALNWYLDVQGENAFGGRMALFDVPLHFNFFAASRSGGGYDMRNILNGTLMKDRPVAAVTFVDNHDSQPLQALESTVEAWFKPLAYAIILLRREGYPCIFYPDYYGASYDDRGIHIDLPSHRWLIDKFLYARHNYGFGDQYDYFDHWDIIGWTRLGDAEHPKAMAVIMSDGPGGGKWMEVGKPMTKFVDITGHIPDPVYTNEWGWAEFYTQGGSVSVWVQE